MTLHRGKTALTAVLTLALCAAALVFSPRCKDGAAKGLELCLRVLTPSLFPMMALSGLTVRTGLCRRIGRLLEKPTRVLFGLSGAFAPVVLLSLIFTAAVRSAVNRRSVPPCSASVRVPHF